MLDKSKVYRIYSGSDKPSKNQGPQRRFRRVKILFEDDLSFYVESLVDKATDSKGLPFRYSIKKHCFYVEEIVPKWKLESKFRCPYCAAGMIPRNVNFSHRELLILFQVLGIPSIVIHTDLYRESNLFIAHGVVIKNRYGPIGRVAQEGDFERADIIVENEKVIRNRITKK